MPACVKDDPAIDVMLVLMHFCQLFPILGYLVSCLKNVVISLANGRWRDSLLLVHSLKVLPRLGSALEAWTTPVDLWLSMVLSHLILGWALPSSVLSLCDLG